MSEYRFGAGGTDPVWDQQHRNTLILKLCDGAQTLALEVYNENIGTPDFLGSVELPLTSFAPNETVRNQYPLDTGGELEVSVNVQGTCAAVQSPDAAEGGTPEGAEGASVGREAPGGTVLPSPTRSERAKVQKVTHVVVHKALLLPARTASLYVSATLRSNGRVQKKMTPVCTASMDGSSCSVDFGESAATESAGLMWDRSKKHHLQFEALGPGKDDGERAAQLVLELWSHHEHLKDELIGEVEVPVKPRGVASDYYVLPCGSRLHVTTYKSRPSRTSLAKLSVARAKTQASPAAPAQEEGEEGVCDAPTTPGVVAAEGGEEDEEEGGEGEEEGEEESMAIALIRRMSTFTTGDASRMSTFTTGSPVQTKSKNRSRAPQAPSVRALHVQVVSAQRLQNVQLFRPMDVFVECTLVGQGEGESKCTNCVEQGGTDPTFAEDSPLKFDLHHRGDALSVRIDVWNRNTVFAAQLVGSTSVQLPSRWEDYVQESIWTSLCNKSLDPQGNVRCRIWNVAV
jgi:hypothetical protein